jgi:hypothetical protein
MLWYLFKLKSTNFVIVMAKTRDEAKEKFKSAWPTEKAKVAEAGDNMNDMPEGAIEVLYA